MQETVKYDGGVTGDYMRLMEDEEYLRECGMREGRQEGIQQSIIEVLETRFPVADELREKIYDQENLNILHKWLKVAANSMTLEDFMEGIE